jgi:AhpD family alkylhydroperoxidase
MSRLPLIDEATASEPVRRSLAAMPPQATVYRLLAHAQTVFPSLLSVVGAIQGQLELDPRLRQLAILRVAVATGCDYERVQHEVIAGIEGVTPEQVAALAAGRIDGPEFGEREQLVLRFVDEVLRDAGAGQQTTAAMAAAFPPREIVELLVVIGQYHATAMLLNTAALEPQPALDPKAILAARARRAALSQPGGSDQ